MHIGQHEMRQVETLAAGPLQALYHRLADREPDQATRAEAAAFLRSRLEAATATPGSLPDTADALLAWMQDNTRLVHARYAHYLEQRRAGAPRSCFANRAHALYVLRSVAPTKLVDGAWLYGLLQHHANPRLGDLVRTYVEELGEGAADRNHVLLYRKLLAQHALDPLDDLADSLFEPGLIQLALGWNSEDFLPEAIGFNLAYEQLPLHLLVTAYELNELGLDPTYFTLHVTVDNAGTGHARRACQAALDLVPRLGDGAAFWRRVQAGARLADLGPGTTEVAAAFDLDAEALRILARKARAGSGAHSDYCRLAGRAINDWLRDPAQMGSFVAALEQAGWIRFGQPAAASRFWQLLQGERAEMFGVFSGYELQVLHDWIRGAASADGRPYDEAAPAGPARRRATFRARRRNAPAAPVSADGGLLDPDLALLRDQLPALDATGQTALLVRAMSPVHHWTPAGLEATRLFWRSATR